MDVEFVASETRTGRVAYRTNVGLENIILGSDLALLLELLDRW